jgi:hypothetical protein
MSLVDPITVDASDGTALQYDRVFEDKTGSKRLSTRSLLSAPEVINISHTRQGKGASAIDRHLVQYQLTKLVSGAPKVMTCNLTFAVPADGSFTSAEVMDAAFQLAKLVLNDPTITGHTAAIVQKILRSES